MEGKAGGRGDDREWATDDDEEAAFRGERLRAVSPEDEDLLDVDEP